MQANFCKLRSGAWGLRGEGSPPRPGAVVQVVRRDGGRVSKTVGAIVWSGRGAWIAEIAPDNGQTSVPGTAPRGHTGTCAECDEYSAHMVPAPDSSGIVGMVCPRCARMSRFERSYM